MANRLSMLIIGYFVVSCQSVIEFTVSEDDNIENLAVDDKNGRVFAGAVNKVYVLNENLDETMTLKTGPTNKNKTVHSKVLVIDSVDLKLVTCGSNANCRLFDLNNLEKYRETDIWLGIEELAIPSVAVVAPNNGTQAIYVAVTRIVNSMRFPIISIKHLENDNNLNDLTSLDDSYVPNMVYGFSYENVIYFLMNQNTILNGKEEETSKVARVCHNDHSFKTYAEFPFVCKKGNVEYRTLQMAVLGKAGKILAKTFNINTEDGVLFTTFTKNNNDQNESAICIYPINLIRKTFKTNMLNCFEGKDMMNNLENICYYDMEDFHESHHHIDGENYVIGKAVLILKAQITSIAESLINDESILILGTVDGRLLKVVVKNSSTAIQYFEKSLVEKTPIKALKLEKTSMYLYAMTRYQVIKVAMQHCSEISTCFDCVSLNDPYCGWCPFENKCSLKSECKRSNEDDTFWISYINGKCPKIAAIEPNNLQMKVNSSFSISIADLKLIDGQYTCVFYYLDEVFSISVANRSSKEVSCQYLSAMPSFDVGDFFNARLDFVSELNYTLATTDVKFVDCASKHSCNSCANFSKICTWCILEHQCVNDAKFNCGNLTIQQNKIENCPAIIANGSDEFLIPHEANKSIEVPVLINEFLINFTFQCQFLIGQKEYTVNAKLRNNQVVCNYFTFVYESWYETLLVPLNILWKSVNRLDNVHNLHVLLYRCNYMAESCGKCSLLNEKYKCVWCSDGCDLQSGCSNSFDRNEACSNAEISLFNPQTGPWEGHTNITIEGVNLGQTFSHIKNIEVAGKNCQPIEHEYKPPDKIVCTVTSSGYPEPELKGPILLQLGNQIIKSDLHYSFVNPSIDSMIPNRGPKFGGTELKISGKHLNAGSNITAYVCGIPCKNISWPSPDELTCITGASGNCSSGILELIFDNAMRNHTEMFYYVSNPVVDRNVTFKGIPSGGIKMHAFGENLEAIQSLRVCVYYGNEWLKGNCSIISDNEMMCLSPEIEINGLNLNVKDPLNLTYDFEMDGKQCSESTNGIFYLYPDPIINFIGDIMFHDSATDSNSDLNSEADSTYLVIDGKYFQAGFDKDDVIVKIGLSECNVTSLSTRNLVCRFPTWDNLRFTNLTSNNVAVYIGNKFSYVIGKLVFQSNVKMIIIGITISLIIIFLTFLVFFFLYRRKVNENIESFKKIKDQMDLLEKKVATECKEAFAELQMEMTDLTTEIIGKMPFFSYRTYVNNILFPNQQNHPIVDSNYGILSKNEGRLKVFEQLILNKTFLMSFIRTIEMENSLELKERIQFASLIMIVLQNKMVYCTEILMALLENYIGKSIKDKKHPKLLLRQTDIFEKMLTAWFTFLLHGFLKDRIGEPLYLLFRSIKIQTETGPIDAITFESKYTLNEKKIIRRTVNYKSLSVYVSITQDLFVSTSEVIAEDIPVRILDCDTISQAKDKLLDAIYKTVHFSKRIDKNIIDLVWRTTNTSSITLKDEDSTSECDGDWKRINTIGHYNVQDQSKMLLTSKSIDTVVMHENEKKSKKKRLNSESAFSSTKRNSMKRKFWHLDKTENDNEHDEDAEKKMVSEIYLTRLLTTKGAVQTYVKDLFESILSVEYRNSPFPLAIKYMFDFLDTQASKHDLIDPEIVHMWKTNSLSLRFWINLIKNPEFVFDIHKSSVVDSCLSIIAQTFIESFSTSELNLGKDSPSSKLLYAKEISSFKLLVDQFYLDVKQMPSVSDQDMNSIMMEHSNLHSNEFNTDYALEELFFYAEKYSEQLILSLQENETPNMQSIMQKFEKICRTSTACVV